MMCYVRWIQTTNTGAGVRCELWSWLLLASLPAWECCSECSHSVHCPRHNVCHGMNNEPGSHRGAACSPVTCATTVHHCVLQPLIECSLYTSWLLAYNCTWLVVNKPLTSSSIVWYVFMKIYLSCLFWIYRKMYAHFIQPQNTKGRLKYEYVRELEIG